MHFVPGITAPTLAKPIKTQPHWRYYLGKPIPNGWSYHIEPSTDRFIISEAAELNCASQFQTIPLTSAQQHSFNSTSTVDFLTQLLQQFDEFNEVELAQSERYSLYNNHYCGFALLGELEHHGVEKQFIAILNSTYGLSILMAEPKAMNTLGGVGFFLMLAENSTEFLSLELEYSAKSIRSVLEHHHQPIKIKSEKTNPIFSIEI